MDITETASEGLKRSYKVVVPAADMAKRHQAKLAQAANRINLPGFRRGKVPATLVEARYGDSLHAELIEETVRDALARITEHHNLRPAAEPKFEGQSLERGGDLAFSFDMEILPEISSPDFTGLALERLTAAIPDEEVEQALREMAEANPLLEDVTEDRGAEAGETLVVDFEGRVDGVAFPGGSAKEMRVKAGGEGFIPGFTEGMVGMKAGETRDIETRFPEEYGQKELAGKAAVFTVTAHKLQRATPTGLDDALAERAGYENLADLRAASRRRLEKRHEGLSRMRLQRALLDRLAEQVSFPVPASLADPEFDRIWAQVERERAAGELDDEDKAKSEEELRRDYRAIAERRVRLGLLLQHVAQENDLKVTEEELRRAAVEEAFKVPQQAMAMLEAIRKNPRLAQRLHGPLLEEKVIDFIVGRAQVTERQVTPAELEAEPEARAA